MRHKTLFRLLIKFLGVYFICEGLIMVFDSLAGFIFTSREHGEYYWPSFIGYVFAIVVGLYLFFGGKWIVDKAIPSNRPYCHECGYDLTGAVGDVCNECGTPFRGEVAPTHG